MGSSTKKSVTNIAHNAWVPTTKRQVTLDTKFSTAMHNICARSACTPGAQNFEMVPNLF